MKKSGWTVDLKVFDSLSSFTELLLLVFNIIINDWLQ